MGLKIGHKPKPIDHVKKVAKGVKSPAIEENTNKQKVRTRHDKPLPGADNLIEETEAAPYENRKTRDFAEITLYGSKGQKYTVAVPASYVRAIPKTWEWTAERYRVAELIAEGIPLKQIPDYPNVTIGSRMTIYGWLEHPEFRNHVDALVLETGWANRRERMSKLARLNEILLNKVVTEIDKVKMTDKMAGALLSALNANAKFLAQEKGEFIEETKVTQDTHVTGAITSVQAKLEDFMASKTDEEKAALEKEFDVLGDDIIRSITGAKE